MHKKFMLLIIVLFLCPTLKAGASQGNYEKDFSKDYYLSGLFDQCKTTFNLGDWNIKGAVLTLEFNASQFLNKKVAYYTIFVNNQPAATFHIPETKDTIIVKEIVLPASLFVSGGYNEVTIETYLRGQTTDACVDDSSNSSWMNIFKESKILISYEPLLRCTNIAEFYEKLTSIEALSSKESMVGISKDANESVFTAMSYALTGISKNAEQDYENIKVGFLEDTDLKNYPYLLYFGEYGSLPASLLEAMTKEQKESAKQDALICLLDLKGKNKTTKVLLVTGSQNEAVINAGIMLTNPDYMKQLNRKEKKITSKENFILPENKVEDYINLSSFGQQVNGIFEQRISFGIDYPANRTIAKSSQLSLDFRYSQNLDFDKSLLTIYINDTPIGSRSLSKEGADGSTEVFDIPTSLSISGGFTVEAAFELYPKEEWCELTPEDIPWGYIENTSMLKLMSEDKSNLYFENFPSPFLKDGMLNNVLLLLPKQPEDEDLETMAGILCTMGRYLKSNAGELEVKFAADSLSLEQVNIISIGAEGRNMLRSSNTAILLDSGFEEQAGLSQLIYSPYGETVQGVLIVTGKNSKDMKKMLYYLGSSEHLWELKGDIAITDGTDLFYAYQKEPESKPEWPVEKKEAMEEGKDAAAFLGSVAVLAVIACTMLGIKYGRAKK